MGGIPLIRQFSPRVPGASSRARRGQRLRNFPARAGHAPSSRPPLISRAKLAPPAALRVDTPGPPAEARPVIRGFARNRSHRQRSDLQPCATVGGPAAAPRSTYWWWGEWGRVSAPPVPMRADEKRKAPLVFRARRGESAGPRRGGAFRSTAPTPCADLSKLEGLLYDVKIQQSTYNIHIQHTHTTYTEHGRYTGCPPPQD